MIRFRNYFYALSLALAFVGFAGLLIWHLPLGTDFTGGSLLDVQFSPSRPSSSQIIQSLSSLNLGDVSVRESGTNEAILQFKPVDEATHQKILAQLKTLTVQTSTSQKQQVSIQELQFNSLGPVLGKETAQKSFEALALLLVAIMAYVTWAFRKVSYPLPSWKYGAVVLVTLFHDLFITIGLFAVIAHFLGLEADVPFVAAVLTILGYSVNDTIVVFDRIRENLTRQTSHFSFADVVNQSVRETFVRSFNSSFTVILVLFAVLFFGGDSIRPFILTLLIGVAVGTYSSIFIASPLMVSWYEFSQKRRKS